MKLNSDSRILITGASGFAGRHLCQRLLETGATVLGAGLPSPAISATHNPFGADHGERWRFQVVDLGERGSATALLTDFEPTAVFHLAAQASAARSFKDPAATFAINLGGTLELLEALRALPQDRRPRMLSVGSAEEYGPAADAEPLAETAPLRPVSPYGVSKVAQTLLCRQYFSSYGLDIVIARPFPHTGIGQSPDFAFPSFARQIAAIESGGAPPILRVGNLEARRDYLHVDDVISAYLALIESGGPGGIYNISSGIAYTVGEGLDMLLETSGLEISIERDPDRYRPLDVPCMLGDNRKLIERTGWRPRLNLETALVDLMNWTRETVE